MKKILIPLITIPLGYLLIALALIFFPMTRVLPLEGLDFDVLSYSSHEQVELENAYYVARDNRKLFYRILKGKADTTIVLLHGSGSEGRYLVPLAQKLRSALQLNVIIPDLRGHGNSIVSEPGDISYLGQYEHDLEDLNHYIKKLNPNAKILLGGHSSGGGLAVKYGGSGFAEYDGYILLAPYLGYQAPTVRPNSGGWVQVAKLRYAGLSMLNNIGLTFLNNLPVLYFNRPAEMKGNLQIESYSYRLNESLSPQTYAADLASNKSPLLLLVGENDEAFYPHAFEEILHVNNSRAQFDIVSGMKHLNLATSEIAADTIVSWYQKTYSIRR